MNVWDLKKILGIQYVEVLYEMAHITRTENRIAPKKYEEQPLIWSIYKSRLKSQIGRQPVEVRLYKKKDSKILWHWKFISFLQEWIKWPP